MKTTVSYKGILNGVHGIWCGHKPEGLEVTEEVTVYHPEEGKVFEKDGELFDCVILKPKESIKSYTEVDAPKEPEEGGQDGERTEEPDAH